MCRSLKTPEMTCCISGTSIMSTLVNVIGREGCWEMRGRDLTLLCLEHSGNNKLSLCLIIDVAFKDTHVSSSLIHFLIKEQGKMGLLPATGLLMSLLFSFPHAPVSSPAISQHLGPALQPPAPNFKKDSGAEMTLNHLDDENRCLIWIRSENKVFSPQG